jgi:hypothetical protein
MKGKKRMGATRTARARIPAAWKMNIATVNLIELLLVIGEIW